METKNFKQLLQPAAKFAGVLGTVGGFVGDVLSPLGPILTYLLYLSIFVLIISVVLLILLSKSKKELFKSASLTSLFFAVIFGVFGQLNEDTDNGFMGDNLEFVSNFQNSLSIIDKKLDNISDQIEVVDEKITNMDEKLDTGLDNLSELIKTSNPIKNPTTPKDYLVNAYLFRNGGDLNKSEEAFSRFFELVGTYKIDVLADFVEVMRNNKGKNFVKTYFETRGDIDDEVFLLFKTIHTSKKSNLVREIQNLTIDKNLIAFGIVHVTNDPDYWNNLYKGTNVSPMAASTTATELSKYDVSLFSTGLDELSHLIINKENFFKLIYYQTNSISRKTYIRFYFDLIEDQMIAYEINEDGSKNSRKKLFLGHIAISNQILEHPNKDASYRETKSYFIEKFGEKIYGYEYIPRDDALLLWQTYEESKKYYDNF